MKRRIVRIPKNEKLNIMINFDNITKENRQEHDPYWQQIPDLQCRIIIVGGSVSGKTSP